VESTVGEGSTFAIVLPARMSEASGLGSGDVLEGQRRVGAR